MPSGKYVLGFDAQFDDEIADGGGEAVHRLAVEVRVSGSTLGRFLSADFFRIPPMLDRLLENFGIGRHIR